MKKKPMDRWVPAGIFLVGLTLWVSGRMLGGTYDSGDSIQHFLISRGAWAHPALFLDHWNKPFFTLISSPFAQLGFGGMQAFNVLCGMGAAFFLFRIARVRGWEWPWLLPLFFLFASATFPILMSGLTEPLFACLLAAGMWAAVRGNPGLALAMASLLPFVRTEGYLVAAVFAVDAVWRGHWRKLPWLGLGWVGFALVGWGILGDPLWQFTQNPYKTLENYGHGTWMHYPNQYFYFAGLPLTLLTALFAVAFPFLLVRLLYGNVGLDRGRLGENFILIAPFAVYIGAHMVFWRFGLFHSLGMTRVMLAVLPSGAVWAYGGLAWVLRFPFFVWLKWKPQGREFTLLGALVGLIVGVFAFLGTPSSGQYRRALSPPADQPLMDSAATWLNRQFPDRPRLWGANPYLSMATGRDPFDSTSWVPLQTYLSAPSGAILVWDSWYSPLESGVLQGKLDSLPAFAPLRQFHTEVKGKPFDIKIYRRRDEGFPLLY